MFNVKITVHSLFYNWYYHFFSPHRKNSSIHNARNGEKQNCFRDRGEETEMIDIGGETEGKRKRLRDRGKRRRGRDRRERE